MWQTIQTIVIVLGMIATIWGFVSSLPKWKPKNGETDSEKEERERKRGWTLLFFSIFLAFTYFFAVKIDGYCLRQKLIGTWKEPEGGIRLTFANNGLLRNGNSDFVTLFKEKYYAYTIKRDEVGNTVLEVFKADDGTSNIFPIKLEEDYIVIGKGNKYFKEDE